MKNSSQPSAAERPQICPLPDFSHLLEQPQQSEKFEDMKKKMEESLAKIRNDFELQKQNFQEQIEKQQSFNEELKAQLMAEKNSHEQTVIQLKEALDASNAKVENIQIRNTQAAGEHGQLLQEEIARGNSYPSITN